MMGQLDGLAGEPSQHEEGTLAMTKTPSPPTPNVSGTFPSTDLIQHTIRIWQPRLGRTLSDEDARQILENITGFFRVLHRWDGNERQAKMDATPSPERK